MSVSTLVNADSLKKITAESIQKINENTLNAREALTIQRFISTMVKLAKTQLEQNIFLNSKEEVTLLKEK